MGQGRASHNHWGKFEKGTRNEIGADTAEPGIGWMQSGDCHPLQKNRSKTTRGRTVRREEERLDIVTSSTIETPLISVPDE